MTGHMGARVADNRSGWECSTCGMWLGEWVTIGRMRHHKWLEERTKETEKETENPK